MALFFKYCYKYLYLCSGYIVFVLVSSLQRILGDISDPIKYIYSASTQILSLSFKTILMKLGTYVTYYCTL